MHCVIYWVKISLPQGTHLLAIYYDPSTFGILKPFLLWDMKRTDLARNPLVSSWPEAQAEFPRDVLLKHVCDRLLRQSPWVGLTTVRRSVRWAECQEENATLNWTGCYKQELKHHWNIVVCFFLIQMSKTWRTSSWWKASRSRSTPPCWTTRCATTRSRQRSSGSCCSASRRSGPSACRPRSTCTTSTWTGTSPTTTCWSRCCMQSERNHSRHKLGFPTKHSHGWGGGGEEQEEREEKILWMAPSNMN